MIRRGSAPGSKVAEREVWALENLESCLDAWIELEQPSDDLRILVTAWVLTRFDDPYADVRREPSFDNLWFGAVPGSVHGQGCVVVCSYWVHEGQRTVRCDSVATLNLPI
jgi:hypothetical protein